MPSHPDLVRRAAGDVDANEIIESEAKRRYVEMLLDQFMMLMTEALMMDGGKVLDVHWRGQLRNQTRTLVLDIVGRTREE